MTASETTVHQLEAGAADLAEVVELFSAQMREHGFPDERSRVRRGVERALGPGSSSRILVARRGGATVGVALVHVLPSVEWGGRSVWIEELFVAPEHRRTGVASALLGTIETLAREVGASGLDLETTPGHEGAERLYAGLGFQPLHRQRWSRKLVGRDEGSTR